MRLAVVDRGGLAAKRGGRRRTEPAAAAFRLGKEGVTGCRRFRAKGKRGDSGEGASG